MIDDPTVSSWPFNYSRNAECTSDTKAQIISYSHIRSRGLLLTTTEEPETHGFLWISVASGPKAEAGSKNSRSTNPCKSVLMAEINIDAAFFFLLLYIKHMLCARPFISIVSFNPQHNLWSRLHCPHPFHRVRSRQRLSNTPKAIQKTREGSVPCFMRILNSIYLDK